jgi:hypothetical protein
VALDLIAQVGLKVLFDCSRSTIIHALYVFTMCKSTMISRAV